jgi:hypothetical protein
MWPAPQIARRRHLYRLSVLLTRAFSGLTGLALLTSRLVCLIVIAWFVVFVADQSTQAAKQQVDKLGSSLQQPAPTHKKESSAKKALNEAAKAITSPFAGLTSHTSSAWLSHGADTVLALLIYGFGVGFLARLVRLRV